MRKVIGLAVVVSTLFFAGCGSKPIVKAPSPENTEPAPTPEPEQKPEQEKYLIALNLKVGQVFRKEMISNLTRTFYGKEARESENLITRFEVLEVLPDKNYRIKISVESLKLNETNLDGKKTSYDSAKSKQLPSNWEDAMLLTHPVIVTVTPASEVIKVEGVTELVDAYVKKSGFAEERANQIKLKNTHQKWVQGMQYRFCRFSESPVAVGDFWDNPVEYKFGDVLVIYDTRRTLTDYNADKLKISLKAKSYYPDGPMIHRQEGMTITTEPESMSTTDAIHDTKTGWILSAELKYNSTTKVTYEYPARKVVRYNKIKSKTTLRLLPEDTK